MEFYIAKMCESIPKVKTIVHWGLKCATMVHNASSRLIVGFEHVHLMKGKKMKDRLFDFVERTKNLASKLWHL